MLFCDWSVRWLNRTPNGPISGHYSSNRSTIEFDRLLSNLAECVWLSLRSHLQVEAASLMTIKMSLPSLPFKRKLVENQLAVKVIATDDSANLFGSKLYTFIKENIDPNKQQSIKKKDNDIGYYDWLPDEIFINILKNLEIEDLGNFCLTNSKIRNFIIDSFLFSKAGYHFLIRANRLEYDSSVDNQTNILDLFTSIGLFIKKSSFVHPTQERINILIHVLENTYGIPSVNTFNSYNFANFKLIYKCYGRVVNKLIAGWGDFECAKVYKELKSKAQIEYHLDRFLKSSLGSKQKLELLIRLFYRMICNSSPDESINFLKDKLFWLSQELVKYSQDQIAKILIVIFGPFISVNNAVHSLPYIAWWDLTDSNFLKSGFEDLGLVLHIYYSFSGESLWSEEFIIDLFEKLINTPTRWTSINVASLLYYTGEKLTFHFLSKKIKEGNQDNVAEYLCYLVVITFKFYRKLTTVAKLIDTLIDQFGGDLIEEISHAFTTIIYEADHLDEDHIDTLPLLDIIESQIEMMRLLMLKVHYLKKFV